MKNYIRYHQTQLLGAFLGVAVFVLMILISGQIVRASTMVPLPSEIFSYHLIISDANCSSVTARLLDINNQPVTSAGLFYYEYDNEQQTVSQGGLTTDHLGLATVTKKDNTVTKIKFIYDETVSAETAISCQPPTAVTTIITTAVKTVAKIATKAAETPAVPITTAVVSTALTVTTLAASAIPAALGFGDLFPLLFNYFLTAFAPKRDRYGFVFDASTQKPTPGAAVQLFNTLTSRIVATDITDKKGRYIFNASKGQYTISVKKDGFIFPSKLITSSSQTNNYYIGQNITVSEQNPAINFLIPIDPVSNAFYPSGYIRRLVQSGSFRYSTMILGTGLAIYSLILRDTVLNYIVIGAFLLLWILEYLLLQRYIKYSRVSDLSTGKPLALALVRVAGTDGKLIETFVSDQFGRVLPQITEVNQQLIVDKSGYKRELLTARGTGLVEKKKFSMTKNI